jgi:hypothetical protein
VDQKYTRRAASISLANQTAVETDVVGRAYSYTENGRFTVDGDSPGADPLFDLAARSNTGAREDLLKSFPCFATPLAPTTADRLLIIRVMLLIGSCIVHL